MPCGPTPCGGLLVEDIEFATDAALEGLHDIRMFRCVGAGHTLMVGVPPETRGAILRKLDRTLCRWCRTKLPDKGFRRYCSRECYRATLDARAKMARAERVNSRPAQCAVCGATLPRATGADLQRKYCPGACQVVAARQKKSGRLKRSA